jgi:hypothetical protein
MTDLQGTLNSWVDGIAEMSDKDLGDMLHLLERTYIHALIEAQLRRAPR